MWRVVGTCMVFGIGILGPFFSGSAHATTGINSQINYQARLLNTAGATVPDGTYNLEFKIYQDGTGCVGGGSSPCSGTLKWTEDWLNTNSQGVTVTNGYFSVMLGGGSDSAALATAVDFNQSALWLSVNIGTTNTSCATFSVCGGDGEMLPFTQFAAAPYALNSAAVGGVQATGLAQLGASQTFTGANILQPTTNITAVTIQQTSVASPTADIFNVQTANGSNVLQVTGPSANNAAVTLQSVGGTNALNLTAAGAFTLSAGADSVVDVGTGHILKLQVANNGPISTGTGTLTDNGPLTVAGVTTLTATGNALKLSTAPSASTSQSLIDLGSAISGGNTAGTFIGVNAASGYAGDLINLQVNGATLLKITGAGDIRQNGGVSTYKNGPSSGPTKYTASATLQSSDLLKERLIITQGPSIILTTPSAATLVGSIQKAAVGDFFSWLWANQNGAGDSLVGGSGVTIAAATSTLGTSKQAYITCRLDNVTSGSEAVTCY